VQRFIENPSISVCLNELVSLEHGEVRDQAKLAATAACIKALELSTEAVQITSDQHVTQVAAGGINGAGQTRYDSSFFMFIGQRMIRN
jgi:hypothetical protein